MNYFYLPENIDFSELEEKYPWTKKKFHKDKLRYIIHLIYINNILNKKKCNSYFPLKCSYLRKILTNEFAVKCKEVLLDCGIIEQEKFGKENYIVGLKSKSYRIANKYSTSKFRRTPILDEKLSERLYKWNLEIEAEAVGNHSGRKLLRDSIYNIDFDSASANIFIDSKEYATKEKKDCRYFYSDLFLSESHFFKRCSAGRCYHLFTSCPSDLRKFSSWNGEKLWMVDVANCQPALHAILYKDKNNIEKSKFSKIVSSGSFYEFINNKLQNKFDLSCKEGIDAIKKEVFNKIFYGDINSLETEIGIKFKQEFPYLSELIKHAKINSRRDLPIFLQKVESELIIDNCASKFASVNKNRCLISIHDSLITTEDNVEELNNLIRDEFYSKLGFNVLTKVSVLG